MISDQLLFDESELRPQYNLLLSTDTTPTMKQLAIYPRRHLCSGIHLFFPQALFLVLFAGASVSTMAMPETSTNAMSLTVEEARISKLRELHPEVADRYSDIVNQAKSSFDHAGDYEAMSLLTHHTGKKLWEAAKRTVAEQAILDDRSLYWSRLSLTAYLRASQFAVPLSSNQRINLIERLENSSRRKRQYRVHGRRGEKNTGHGF